MGYADADTEENQSGSKHCVIAPVACAVPNRAPGAPKLSGDCALRIVPGTILHRIYGCTEAVEGYFCNYEVNPAYRGEFEHSGLIFSAMGPDGEPRAAELPHHPFFLPTLFHPALGSEPGRPHPLIAAFFKAAAG